MLMTVAAVLRWRLTRIGIHVVLYYWIQEGRHDVSLSPLRDESNFSFGIFDTADLNTLGSIEPDAFPGWRITELLAGLQVGKLCFGAKFNNEIVAMTTLDLDDARFLGKTVTLASHEAYLGDMFTRKKFRGRNIAPHLRYRAYAALRDVGKTAFYSYTDVLNIPALQFEKKLNARYLWLGLHIEIFRKYSWHWRVRTYSS